MPFIQKAIETGYAFIAHYAVIEKVLSNEYVMYPAIFIRFRYISSGVSKVVSYGQPVVAYCDLKIDSIMEKAVTVKDSVIEKTMSSKNQVEEYIAGLVSRYNHEKSEVVSKAKGYKAALTEQISVISDSAQVNGLKEKVAESVRQAPDMMRSISNKAVSLTKQGLEISIGQEKTETVMNTVKTHTPKFVSSLLSMETSDLATEASPASVAAH